MWHHTTMVAKFWDHNNRELKQLWQWRQREWQKSSRFILTKQKLFMCIMLFCTFLSRRCTIPNLTHSLHGEGEHNIKTSSFFFLTLRRSFQIQPQKILQTSAQIKWNWIRSMTFWNSVHSLFRWPFQFVVIQQFCYHGNVT